MKRRNDVVRIVNELAAGKGRNVNELKPCPKCKKPPYTDAVNCGHIWGYGIGCANIFCENAGSLAIIKYAYSKEKAKKKAEKAWNRRTGK